MKRINSVGTQSATGSLLLIIALIVSLAPAARADRKAEARHQFEHAVKMRTMLEGYLPKDRTLADYKQTIAAYKKVYLISTQAEEVTPSLVAEAELYREMGRQFDPKFFHSAIDAYNFLLKQYPTSRYRGGALYSIGEIYQDDLDLPDKAQETFKEYVKRFPKSDHSNDARAALKEIASNRESDPVADIKGPIVEPRESSKRTPSVTDIRTWNAQSYTRIVVTLDDTIKYDAARIPSPDRIYFDLYKANISPSLKSKKFEVKDGLLKSVRVAQNKTGVVRLVLDVDGARNYSVFLLSNPYRLVIDVRTEPVTTAKNGSEAAPTITSAKADPEKTELKPVERITVNAGNAPPAANKPSSKASVKPAAAKPKTNASNTTPVLKPPTEPKPNRDGQRSLTRELGLKINRIVIDPGHGGHDTGTIGQHGLLEKDLCLDVALRLGRIIEEKLPGADVIFTRKDDTFVPLENRTAIANQAKADLFISIHANSSHNHDARGVETFYLNFATSQESMAVATRENALSQSSLHDLQDLIKKIARNEKIEESKELATDIQGALAQRLQVASREDQNRGVKKAPFIVLIGADMPSVLSEIAFISNPSDERLLRKGDQRQKVAEGLYHGISAYLDSLNSLSYNKQKLVSDNHVPAVASDGNPK